MHPPVFLLDLDSANHGRGWAPLRWCIGAVLGESWMKKTSLLMCHVSAGQDQKVD